MRVGVVAIAVKQWRSASAFIAGDAREWRIGFLFRNPRALPGLSEVYVCRTKIPRLLRAKDWKLSRDSNNSATSNVHRKAKA